jgi:hypothetical protein
VIVTFVKKRFLPYFSEEDVDDKDKYTSLIVRKSDMANDTHAMMRGGINRRWIWLHMGMYYWLSLTSMGLRPGVYMSQTSGRMAFRLATEQSITSSNSSDVTSSAISNTRAAPFTFFTSDAPMSIIAYRVANTDRYMHVAETRKKASGSTKPKEPSAGIAVIDSIVAFLVDWQPYGHVLISMAKNDSSILLEHARMIGSTADWFKTEIQGGLATRTGFYLEPTTASPPSSKDCVVNFDDLSFYRNISYPSIQGKWIYNPTVLDIGQLFTSPSSTSSSSSSALNSTLNSTLMSIDIGPSPHAKTYFMCARASWRNDPWNGRSCESLKIHDAQMKCLWEHSNGTNSWITNAATVCGQLNPLTCKVDYQQNPLLQGRPMFHPSSWSGGRGWHDTRTIPMRFTNRSEGPGGAITTMPFLIVTSLSYQTVRINTQLIHVKLPSVAFFDRNSHSRKLTRLVYYDPTRTRWGGADTVREHICAHRSKQKRPDIPSLPSVAHLKNKVQSSTLKNPFVDKNWAAFVYENRVLWSRHIRSHEVCENDIDLMQVYDACAICKKVYEARSNETMWAAVDLYAKRRMHRMAPFHQRLPRHFLNSSVVRYHLSGCAAHFIPSRNVYIGTFHAVVAVENAAHSYLDYQQYFYLLQPRPPFAVIGISCEIDFIKMGSLGNMWFRNQYRSVSFVAGFQYIPEDVGSEFLISYGVGDYISAVKRLSEKDVFDSFSCI